MSAANSVQAWILQATNQLKLAGIATARLDALVLLADELECDKSWLLAHPEQKLSSKQLESLDKKLALRAERLPLAYIRCEQEFFGRKFNVTPDVLIPRPETEAIIEQLLALQPRTGDMLADIGTGSGVIAITAKLELPNLHVIATDVSVAALGIAQKNAARLGAEIEFIQQDLLEKSLPQPVQFLMANLPYVDRNWQRSAETNAEPALALFADDDGLALVKKLIQQSVGNIAAGGYMLLEADPRQHQVVVDFAAQHNYAWVTTQAYVIVLQVRIGL